MSAFIMSPLSGMRVIDLAGPSAALASRRLGDLGAEIIKIEPPWGDPSRQYQPFANNIPGPSRSLWFLHNQQNKFGLILDIEQDTDRETLRHLIAGADVIIETFAPGYLENLGLGYKALRATNQGLIYAAVTGFGQHGPWQNYRSNDVVAAATGGQLSVCGLPHRPLKIYGQQCYLLASYFCVIGIMLALRERNRSGLGQFLDISLQESVAATLDHALPRYQMLQAGLIPTRRGNRHWNGSFAVVPGLDGHLLISPAFGRRTLAGLIADEGVVTNLGEDQWDDSAYLLANFEEAVEQVSKYTIKHNVGELAALGQAMRLPWATVASPDRVVDSPQLKSRDFWVGVKHRGIGEVTLPRSPVKFSSIRLNSKPAPLLGEHNSLLKMIRQDWRSLPVAQKIGNRTSPLDGIRILDFTRVLSGPYATRLLADFGAEVIKLQTHQTANGIEDNQNGYFYTWNRNKLAITLNLDHSEGRHLALELISKCDVVIENFTPRVLENWDLAYHRLKEAKPDIILVSLSGAGNCGPWRDYTAFGATVEATSGLTGLTAFEEGIPIGSGFALADHASGLVAVWAILAAMAHRDHTGEGQYVDISEYEVMCNSLAPALMAVMNSGQIPKPTGNQPEYDPEAINLFCRCNGVDRWCVTTIESDRDWQALGYVLGHPNWMSGQRFENAFSRRAHVTEIERGLEIWTRGVNAHEVMRRFQAAGLAAGVIEDTQDLLLNPQLAANGFFQTMNHPMYGDIKLDRPPIRLEDTPARFYRQPPTLGQDNDYIFGNLLGLSAKQIAEYVKREIIF